MPLHALLDLDRQVIDSIGRPRQKTAIFSSELRNSGVLVLAEEAIYPDDFDMDDKAARGIWDFGSGERIRIKLRFTAQAGEHLYETPLSTDQTIEETGDGYLIVTATVADTPQLKWWITAFGDQVNALHTIHGDHNGYQ